MKLTIPGQRINVLDHGYVEMVDWMGDDRRVCDSARISYEGKAPGEDRSLIRYMMEHGHSSPFEQVVFTFEMKLPIFVARQMVRHRTARLNEMSGRYSELPEEFYVPELSRLQRQSTSNKQGSKSDLIDDPNWCRNALQKRGEDGFATYQQFVDSGLALELARIDLPLSTYTKWRWQFDLHNLMHFLKLRLDNHAQYEIRVYAEAMRDLVAPIVPLTMEAFDNYVIESVSFAGDEQQWLIKVFARYANPFGLPDSFWKDIKNEMGDAGALDGSKRRINDFIAKVKGILDK